MVEIWADGKTTGAARIVELTENARDELPGDEFRPIPQSRGTIVALERATGVVHAKVEDREVADELPDEGGRANSTCLAARREPRPPHPSRYTRTNSAVMAAK